MGNENICDGVILIEVKFSNNISTEHLVQTLIHKFISNASDEDCTYLFDIKSKVKLNKKHLFNNKVYSLYR